MSRFAAALICLVLSAFAVECMACQCGELPSEDEAWQNAAVVFQGEVVSIARVLSATASGEKELAYQVTFAVSREGKALGFRTRQLVQRSIGGGTCDGPFEVGRSYVVFAERNAYFPGTLRADVCHQPREHERTVARLTARSGADGLMDPGASRVNKIMANVVLHPKLWIAGVVGSIGLLLAGYLISKRRNSLGA